MSTRRADTRAPLRVFDNSGQPLNPALVGKTVGFLFAGEILRRLDARKAAELAKAGAA